MPTPKTKTTAQTTTKTASPAPAKIARPLRACSTLFTLFALSTLPAAASAGNQGDADKANSAQAAASQTGNEAASTCAKNIDSYLARYLKPANAGAAVIVTRKGDILLRKAYGMADTSQHLALQADMPLRVGSVTKQFTAAAIMLLAEEGKLAVTDDIHKYLPDYPTQGKLITIENLLTHTSGIRNYTALPGFYGKAVSQVSTTEAIDYFKNATPEFAPGERFSYSNSNYFLLGVIIEKISGLSYADFMQQRIFNPLGLQHSFIETDNGKHNLIVHGYGRRQNEEISAPQYSMSWPYAAGALRSSADDLAAWNRAIVTGRLLSAESWKKMRTPYVFKTEGKDNGKTGPYGYGFFFRKIHGQDVIEHGGDIPGFSAGSLYLPADDLYVAVLANSDALTIAPDILAETIADKVGQCGL
ncbi:serine hydrolase domain-containing protein [Undibacterium sp. TS12]|uniref:serine hydrolase domain-containing protein n=1 Tax=Undibacterium sp. TS12 TaxID=2908202 RepID=UPI001F4C808B|nr:serine hydrolase domain-containing protein [Undibacterium sp. TS12]MCH8622540.1 beta-lactamase family protein [Undibacterium sp. TS12]